jgi:hypothetical protein
MSTSGTGSVAANIVDPLTSATDAFQRALRGYLAIVATALGIGLESCTLDIDTPVSAYLAVDHRTDSLPERDLALLWEEHHGWSIAAETHSGEDLIVLGYLATDTVVPPVELVVRFVEEFCAGDTHLCRSDPRVIGNIDAARHALGRFERTTAPLPSVA